MTARCTSLIATYVGRCPRLVYLCSLCAHIASHSERYRCPWRASSRMDGRAPVHGPQRHARHFNQSVPPSITSETTFLTECCSHHGGLPLRQHDRTDVERAPWLEQRIHVHEQYNVWSALCSVPRALPDQGSRHRQCHRCLCQPRVRHHGERIHPAIPCFVANPSFEAPIIALYANLQTAVPVYVSGALFLVSGFIALLLPFEPRGKASI